MTHHLARAVGTDPIYFLDDGVQMTDRNGIVRTVPCSDVVFVRSDGRNTEVLSAVTASDVVQMDAHFKRENPAVDMSVYPLTRLMLERMHDRDTRSASVAGK